MSRSRTNIEIDDGYVQTVMDRYGVHTKTEAVDLALRHLAGSTLHLTSKPPPGSTASAARTE